MLEAFTAALSLITASEIGDKTFFMAVILAATI
jgi:putative Ca2+/H+ antiporter (TMEM165/GDT1 family)